MRAFKISYLLERDNKLASEEGRDRRELFRMTLPKDYVVVCSFKDKKNCRVIDLAENGIRCVNSLAWTKKEENKKVSFSLAYPDGELVAYKAIVIRVTSQDIAFQIPDGIALPKMIEIQRDLIKKFNVTEF